MENDRVRDVTRPKVAIIILNWNGWRDTIECLESIEKITYPNYEVVLVDNGSTDDSILQITKWINERSHYWGAICGAIRGHVRFENFSTEVDIVSETHRIVLVKTTKNIGFCDGNNLGMLLATRRGAEFLLILNNDTIVTPSFLEPLIQAATSNADIGLIGGIILYTSCPEKVSFAGGQFNTFLEDKRLYDGFNINHVPSTGILETDLVSGCMMLIPSTVYRSLGGFNPKLYFSSEDWDYSIRVRRAGYRLVVVTGSRIFHKIGRSAGVLQPLSYYYGTRNRLLLKKTYLPWYLRILFMMWFLPTRFIRYTAFALKGRWDLVLAGCEAILDYFAGKTGKWRRHLG